MTNAIDYGRNVTGSSLVCPASVCIILLIMRQYLVSNVWLLIELSLQCEYVRQRKKRGKVSKRELEQAAVAAVAAANVLVNSSMQQNHSKHALQASEDSARRRDEMIIDDDLDSGTGAGDSQHNPASNETDPTSTDPFMLYETSPNRMHAAGNGQTYSQSPNDLAVFLALATPGSPPSPNAPMPPMNTPQPMTEAPTPAGTTVRRSSISIPKHSPPMTMSNAAASASAVDNTASASQSTQNHQRSGSTPAWFALASPPEPVIPEYVSQPSSLGSLPITPLPPTPTSNPRYPVLSGVISQLNTFMPSSLPSDLLEDYFTRNIYCLAPILRRSSIMSHTRPRECSSALVYALLLSAAYTSDNPHMTSSPSARLDIIHRLLDLCVSTLRPLLHTTVHGTLDDVMTYIHLGTVTSASEFKGSSLRWWNAGWALAKELKLNTEHADLDDETREEMRRTWWLLYMVDRHLGLCYNRPLTILDSQCMSLYQPLATEEEWLSVNSDGLLTPPELVPDSSSRKGVTYTVAGTSIYGFFLPLMAILGGIVEVHHLEQNPMMRLYNITSEMRQQLSNTLDQFESSLRATSDDPGLSNVWRHYATHLSYVLRILLAGYWDPLDLLYAPDSLLSTTEFMNCTSHALRSADAVKSVLRHDPELMFMPFFFGVYLLHGSFIWLMLVDKLESNVSEEVREACETVVRAHEVCIVTLNTEYQRNFRRVMRGALVGMGKPLNGHIDNAEIRDEGRRRRREIVGLYRWCAGGSGLAV